MRKTNQPFSFWWWRWIHYQELGELFQALGNLLHSIPISSFSALFENRNNLISIHLLINMIPWMLQETFIQEVLREVHSRNLYSRSSPAGSALQDSLLFAKMLTSSLVIVKFVRVMFNSDGKSSCDLTIIFPVCAEGKCSPAVCLRADIRVCANNQPVKVLSFYLSGWIYTHGFSST